MEVRQSLECCFFRLLGFLSIAPPALCVIVVSSIAQTDHTLDRPPLRYERKCFLGL